MFPFEIGTSCTVENANYVGRHDIFRKRSSGAEGHWPRNVVIAGKYTRVNNVNGSASTSTVLFQTVSQTIMQWTFHPNIGHQVPFAVQEIVTSRSSRTFDHSGCLEERTWNVSAKVHPLTTNINANEENHVQDSSLVTHLDQITIMSISILNMNRKLRHINRMINVRYWQNVSNA